MLQDNPALGYWVASQRAREAKGRLSPEDTRRLAALGFRFANGRPFSDADIHRRLEVLSAFRRETGRGIPVKQDSEPDYSSPWHSGYTERVGDLAVGCRL